MKKDAFLGRVESNGFSGFWAGTVFPILLSFLFALVIWLTAVNAQKANGASAAKETETESVEETETEPVEETETESAEETETASGV